MQSLTFFKANNVYTDEHEGMRYKVFTEKNEYNTVLKVSVWPCPWCFDKTEEEHKTYEEFELNDTGLQSAEKWICEQFENNADIWRTRRKNTLF